MKAGIVVRQAGLTDLDSIVALEATCFGVEAFTRRQIRYLLDRAKGQALVAEENGRVVGWLSLLMRRRLNNCRVYSLAVDAASRGKGIAGSLMECAIDFARAHGCKTLSLEVDIANHAALALYVKKGFFQCGLKPAYYKDGSDARAMLLML